MGRPAVVKKRAGEAGGVGGGAPVHGSHASDSYVPHECFRVPTYRLRPLRSAGGAAGLACGRPGGRRL